MTGEVLYKNVLTMITAYEEASGTQLMDKIIAHPEEWENQKYMPFYSSAAKLILEARRQMDKATTGSSVVSAAKRILKNASEKSFVPPWFHGVFLYDEKFVICDGIRMVRFNNDIAQLPHTDADSSKRPTNLKNIMNNMNLVKKEGETLNLPDIRTLKEFLIENKASARAAGIFRDSIPLYCIDNYIWVNPNYLMDMLCALPGCVAYKPDCPVDPIYFKAENGDGFFIPVRHKAEN